MVFVVPGGRAAAACALCVAVAAACPLSCCFQYHNKLRSSTLTHHALRQMAASSPFVCLLLCGEAAVRERKLFCRHPGPHVPAKRNRNEIWLAQKVCVAGGEWPSEASSGPSHQREECDLMPVTQLSYKFNEKQCRPESWSDGQPANNISINAEVSHSELFECSLECSYVQQLPLEPPRTHTLPVDFKHRKGRSGWGEAICVVTDSVRAEPSGKSGRQLDNSVYMRPH